MALAVTMRMDFHLHDLYPYETRNNNISNVIKIR